MKTEKEKIKNLKREVKFLNMLLSISQEGEWDLDGIYDDIVSGKDEFGEEREEYTKQFAEWFAKRYGIKSKQSIK